MNFKTIFAMLVCGVCLGALADQTESGPVIHIDHEQVATAFAKGTPIVVTNNFKVQTGNRTGPGEVEIHERDTDIFYILEGSATFVTGGQPVEAKVTGPGETRARKMTGGEEHHLTKGDVIVIPNGVPHWFKEVPEHVVYYVVKVTR
jgi:glc operon protein GlcG